MKIGYLTNQYPNASCTFIRRELKAVEAEGFQIERLSSRPGEYKPVDLIDKEEEGLTRYLLASKSDLLKALAKEASTNPVRFAKVQKSVGELIKTGAGPVRHLAYLAQACLLKQIAHDEGLKHVHVHFGTNPTAVAMLSRKLGGPSYSFSVHGPTEFDFAGSISLDAKIADAAFVVAISEFCRSQLMRFSNFEDWNKIEIVHCGLEKSFINSDAEVSTSPTFVTIGRLSEQKGYGVLLDALKICKDAGLDFKVRMVGDGPQRKSLERKAKQLGVTNFVDFLGWGTEETVVAEIENARALILPSFAEGLPVVLMESYALRTPAIASNVAAVSELVEGNETGWLIHPGNAQDLANAIQKALMAEEETLTKFAEAGRQRVLKNHDIAKEAKTLARLFDKYVEGVKHGSGTNH